MKLKAKDLIESFTFAYQGVIEALKKERNLRIHILFALLVLCLALVAGVSRWEFLILMITIVLVIVMELLNTSIEAIIDLVSPGYHPLARYAKNVAAGAVLITALNAVGVGFFIFINNLGSVDWFFFRRIQAQPPYFSLLALIFVLAIILFLKTRRKTDFSLQGGMPSAHSALAFSLATINAFMTEKAIVIAIGYLLAIIVAQSRVEGQIHNLLEVVIGAVLGFLITLIFFQTF